MQQDIRYPIGKYQPQIFSEELKSKWLFDLETLPGDVERAVLNLDEAQLQTPYRDGGWTLHQVVHHLADSHINSYVRFKLALTEDNPTIKTYDEKLWSELGDVKTQPINVSITLLHALHLRWVALLQSLNKEDWNKTIYNPGSKKEMTLWFLLGMYSWHGRHHTAHITELRERMNW
ncbi:YfiT family bacillithiol transferase [Arachidicoccus sp.]|uniref:YfiT family bacillithiol transferase n=1 Tax=Arachidicoccus sp. TaxID=1872624 RepID=UPI003D191D07